MNSVQKVKVSDNVVFFILVHNNRANTLRCDNTSIPFKKKLIENISFFFSFFLILS